MTQPQSHSLWLHKVKVKAGGHPRLSTWPDLAWPRPGQATLGLWLPGQAGTSLILTTDAFPKNPHSYFKSTILSTESIFIIPPSLHTFSSSYTHVQRPSLLSIKTLISTGTSYLSPSFFVKYSLMIHNPEYYPDSLLTPIFLIPGFLDFPTFSSAHDKSPFLSDYSKPFSRPLAMTDFAALSSGSTSTPRSIFRIMCFSALSKLSISLPSTTFCSLDMPSTLLNPFFNYCMYLSRTPISWEDAETLSSTLSSTLAIRTLSTKNIICENGMLRQCKPTLYYKSTSLNSLQSDLAVIDPLEPYHTFSHPLSVVFTSLTMLDFLIPLE